jgi:rod shape-determining protein MreD
MYRSWLIVFGTTLLLWSLVGQLNHYLAPCGAFLSVGGLLVTFAALRLDLRRGLTATILIALAVDAVEPVPQFDRHLIYGPNLLLFTAAHVLAFHLRTRFPRDETLFGLVTALLANLGIFLGLSFIYIELGAHPVAGTAWLRLFADLGWSQLFILLVAPWYLALQKRALELGRVDLAAQHPRFF